MVIGSNYQVRYFFEILPELQQHLNLNPNMI